MTKTDVHKDHFVRINTKVVDSKGYLLEDTTRKYMLEGILDAVEYLLVQISDKDRQRLMSNFCHVCGRVLTDEELATYRGACCTC